MSTHVYWVRPQSDQVMMSPRNQLISARKLIHARRDITPKKLAQLLQQAYNQGRKDLSEQIKEIQVRITSL